MSTLALGIDQSRLELRQYWRVRALVFFSFLFPILLFALFATIFQGDLEAGGSPMNAAQVYLPGMVASGVMLSSFQTLAFNVALLRDDGTLKRVRATPLPPAAYFMGKVGMVAVTSILQAAILLLAARLLFSVEMPTTGRAWGLFFLIWLVGSIGGTLLGIAYSTLATPRSATAVIVGPLVLLQFISGVYFPFSELPSGLQTVASIFPLKWIAQGMREVFYPPAAASLEVSGSYQTGLTFAVLIGWAVAGAVLTVLTFRWTRRGDV